MEQVSRYWKRLNKSQHFRHGLPLLLLTFGGAFVVQLYSQIRYESKEAKKTMIKSKELSRMIGQREQKTLEEEYEEMRETIKIDGWKNIRGPRPWEEDNQEYKELIERRALEAERGWVFSKTK